MAYIHGVGKEKGTKTVTSYYKATFSNGRVLTRATASRKYSHAYLVCGTYSPEYIAAWEARAIEQGRTGDTWRWGHDWSVDGFSGRADLANKAVASATGGKRKPDVAEVVPTVEIDGKEYRALNKMRKEPRPC